MSGYTPAEFFAAFAAGNAAVDLIYGQNLLDTGILLANGAAAGAAALVTDQVLNSGSILYFVKKDDKANGGATMHVAQDMFEGFGVALLAGGAANYAVRTFLFGVPVRPALTATAAGMLVTWYVYIMPMLSKAFPHRN